ncbi:helix-turn-helix transcriptional regulator [Lachnoclostridium sp. Marseille-P6806]|uniref:helix-turn-helix transcriptional regulator n=1 Tax=Lachnoclostridium sp. Marseille-P6806 TaxID=2364793 RepID=UPI00102F6BE7|nr:AraC family transcriptional regulator [Lachnoclostridium sp. Marseille-P6806]
MGIHDILTEKDILTAEPGKNHADAMNEKTMSCREKDWEIKKDWKINWKKGGSCRYEAEHGYYEITAYPFLPGFYVLLREVHALSVPIWPVFSDEKVILLNYCIEGSCEFSLCGGRFNCLRNGCLSFGSARVSGGFVYPSGYYLGFEILIVPSMISVSAETQRTLGIFGIEWKALTEKYNASSDFYLGTCGRAMQSLWLELYIRGHGQTALTRLNILKILYLMQSGQELTELVSGFLAKKQNDIAKSVCSLIERDISSHISVRSMAEAYGLSESSIKSYFSKVYGKSISEYRKEQRLKHAAALLAGSSAPVSDIAAACGYGNQGRFSRLFREYSGMNPLDYRRQAEDIPKPESRLTACGREIFPPRAEPAKTASPEAPRRE